MNCGDTLEQPHRGGSYEYRALCFEAKRRKIVIFLQTPVLLSKSGV